MSSAMLQIETPLCTCKESDGQLRLSTVGRSYELLSNIEISAADPSAAVLKNLYALTLICTNSIVRQLELLGRVAGCSTTE